MQRRLILGAGTAGTMIANQLRPKLDPQEWSITIVDQQKTHYYQPGLLFLPFDIYKPKQIRKPIKKFIPSGVKWIQAGIDRIVPDSNRVNLDNDQQLGYDILIIATGTRIAPQETEGMLGPGWRKDVFDFYTFEGAKALRDKLRTWQAGKLVVQICEMPIKCPVAPLEFAF